ncbi:MAG: DUF3597 family protein, partial [Candidatus Aminicenantes bacterium]|nr:DUF3597 family protein [Candidatus Aminicenantes bacterium]
MGYFDKIMDKLNFNKAAASGEGKEIIAAASAPKAIPVFDVMAQMENLAVESKEKLNWKVSIVDLLKLLKIDSSYAARKEMAVELGCPT